jgi:hypothetical protein
MEWTSLGQVLGLCSGSFLYGLRPQGQAASLTTDISLHASFLLQPSSAFNEGEQHLGATPGEEEWALTGQWCFWRSLHSSRNAGDLGCHMKRHVQSANAPALWDLDNECKKAWVFRRDFK